MDLETRQHTIATALSNTSTWIFERPEFRDWLERRNVNKHKGMLWIKGKPGSGKSVVMKNTLQRIQLSQSSSTIISFFFNARGVPLEKTPLGLFRSLLHQLLQQQRHLLSNFLPIYRKKRDTLLPGWKWQEEELREYFSSIITTTQASSIIVFIDALDECEEEKVRRLVSFFAKLTSSAVSSGCKLNICMSSRHYPYISVPGCLEIFTESWNSPDISKYVESELCLQSEQGIDFQKEVVEKASGVFLWVVLVVELLLQNQDEGAAVKEMRQILRSVPDELDKLFTEYFETISAKDRKKTLNLMQWILFAERPLTPMEINCALAFSVEYPPKSQKAWEESDGYLDDDAKIEKALRTLSKGLVEITQGYPGGGDSGNKEYTRQRVQNSGRVQFIHESVRDFLLHYDGLQLIDSSLGLSAIGKSHDQLTKACICYLSIEELQADQFSNIYDDDEGNKAALDVINSYAKYVFWEYAVTSLFKHATKAENAGTEQRYLARLFLYDRQPVFHTWRYFNDCLSAQGYGYPQGTETTFLHIASESGLLTCVSDLLNRGVEVNIKGGRYGYALVAAASKGHETMVRVLLENGAEVDAGGGDTGTALQWAAVRGNEAIVRLLLENGAEVNAGDGDRGTALHLAAVGFSEAIVRLLLENGAEVDAGGRDTGTALHWAAGGGNEAIVRLLLEKGADVQSPESSGWNALLAAAENGHDPVVKLLLEAGVSLNAQEYGKALEVGAYNGNEALVQLLTEKGAGINAQGDKYGDALQVGCIKGHTAIVDRLIHAGADPNKVDEHGWTPILCASRSQQKTVLERLLAAGGDLHLAAPNRIIPPTSWSTTDKSASIVLDENAMTATYIGKIFLQYLEFCAPN